MPTRGRPKDIKRRQSGEHQCAPMAKVGPDEGRRLSERGHKAGVVPGCDCDVEKSLARLGFLFRACLADRKFGGSDF